MTDEAWERVLTVNLTTAFLCTRAAARVMREQRYGRIVYISSTAKDGVPWFAQAGVGRSNYAAAKMGLLGLARAAAAELASHGVTVNVVVPGPILTPRTAPGFRRLEEDERVRAKPLDVIPLGRYGVPQDVANAVAFLVSDDAAYITGHELYVSGGLE
jgi:3-oxoacyl-[acyl-carrier protein] reductase